MYMAMIPEALVSLSQVRKPGRVTKTRSATVARNRASTAPWVRGVTATARNAVSSRATVVTASASRSRTWSRLRSANRPASAVSDPAAASASGPTSRASASEPFITRRTSGLISSVGTHGSTLAKRAWRRSHSRRRITGSRALPGVAARARRTERATAAMKMLPKVSIVTSGSTSCADHWKNRSTSGAWARAPRNAAARSSLCTQPWRTALSSAPRNAKKSASRRLPFAVAPALSPSCRVLT